MPKTNIDDISHIGYEKIILKLDLFSYEIQKRFDKVKESQNESIKRKNVD